MSWRPTIAILIVLAALGAACGDDAGGADSALNGDGPMADIAVYDFESQPAVVRHEGRPVVVNFFAETCAPCVAEMPAFETVFQTLADRVDFVGISEDATPDAGARLVAATGITYRAVWDGDGTALSQFQAFALPTTVFVTADGAVAAVHTGALTAEDLRTNISELLGV